MKKLAVFDIDGVLYNGHTIFDIIQKQENEGFVEHGTWKKIENEMVAYKSGEKNYKESADGMLNAYLTALKGKSYNEVKSYLSAFFKSEPRKFYPYFKKVLPQLKKTYDVYLLTTNLHVMADTLVEYFGLKGFLSTEEEIVDGIYTGKMIRSLAGHKSIIKELLNIYPFKGSLAVGDSQNDISMLKEVENPLCINPDHDLELCAKRLHWRIVSQNDIENELLQVQNNLP